MATVMVVDGANVVGSRPDGWWKDRAGAARRLHEALLVADLPHDKIVLVLEGQAKGGVRAGKDAHVRTVHAPKDGDAAIVDVVREAVDEGRPGDAGDRRPDAAGSLRRCHRARAVLVARPDLSLTRGMAGSDRSQDLRLLRTRSR